MKRKVCECIRLLPRANASHMLGLDTASHPSLFACSKENWHAICNTLTHQISPYHVITALRDRQDHHVSPYRDTFHQTETPCLKGKPTRKPTPPRPRPPTPTRAKRTRSPHAAHAAHTSHASHSPSREREASTTTTLLAHHIEQHLRTNVHTPCAPVHWETTASLLRKHLTRINQVLSTIIPRSLLRIR